MVKENDEASARQEGASAKERVATATTKIDRNGKYWIIAAIAATTLVVLLVVVAMLGAALHGIGRYGGRANMVDAGYGYGGRGGGQMMRGEQFYDDSSARTDVARIAGVITAVDGATLTVAGNGTSTKVTTSDATIYSGDDSTAKVNDTVMVLGNKTDDGTVAASRIVISRQ